MNKYKETNFQIDAIEKLYNLSKSSIENEKKDLYFKSPTGSGKTYMLSKFIESFLYNNINENFSFFWITPATSNIHIQNYKKINFFIKDFDTKLIDTNDNIDNPESYINSISIINWEKMEKNGKNIQNKLMKNSEYKNLPKLWEQLNELNSKIIFIIDESHIRQNSKTLSIIKKMASPKLIIHTSATLEHPADIEVKLSDCIEENFLRKKIIINNDINSSNLLKEALKFQTKLKNNYLEENYDINPLLVIQLENEKIDNSNNYTYLDIKETLITSHNILEEEIAINLSDKKINLSDLEKKNAKQKILIAKEAIIVGWDCPRAQILLKYRNGSNSHTFETQLLGRFLRKVDKVEYSTEELNNAYVFIDTDRLSFDNYLLKSTPDYFLNTKKMILKEKYIKNINLPNSIFLPRVDYGAILPKKIKPELEKNVDLNIQEKLLSEIQNLEKVNVYQKLLQNEEIFSIDTITNKTIKNSKNFNMNDTFEIENLFINYLKQLIRNFGYPEVRSISPLKSGIYKILEGKPFNLKLWQIHKLVLTSNYMKDIISSAISNHKKMDEEEIKKKKRQNVLSKSFEIINLEVPENWTEKIYKKTYTNNITFKIISPL